MELLMLDGVLLSLEMQSETRRRFETLQFFLAAIAMYVAALGSKSQGAPV